MIRDRKPRFTRLRAVLAGGLVLGVGVTATLAAWTDEEHTAGGFAAGTFSIVGSTNGTDYSDHPSAPGAALNFTLTPNAMVPGATVYALYSVKTKVESVAGSVQLMAHTDNKNGLGAYLEYGVNTITDKTCNAVAFTAGTPVVGPKSKLTTGAVGNTTLAAAGASPVNYCFAVTLPSGTSNEAQGTTLDGQWTFQATTDPAGS
jgi:predicted ribosomally synthesized peptide with SipW-like signal peptide